jgi:hypothetical protein
LLDTMISKGRGSHGNGGLYYVEAVGAVGRSSHRK